MKSKVQEFFPEHWKSHFRDFYRLDLECLGQDHWGEESWEKLFDSTRNYRVFGQSEQGELLGICLCEVDEQNVHILKVATRRKREGRALEIFEKMVEKVRPSRVTLEVRQSNQAAMSFYQKLGFSFLEETTRYSDGEVGIKAFLAISVDNC